MNPVRVYHIEWYRLRVIMIGTMFSVMAKLDGEGGFLEDADVRFYENPILLIPNVGPLKRVVYVCLDKAVLA
jgi:hypothetical protein